MNHSDPMRKLIKFQILEIKHSKGEQVCLKDCKDIFALNPRKWGMESTNWAVQQRSLDLNELAVLPNW